MATTPPTQNAPRASLLRLAYGSAPQRRSRTTSAIINNQPNKTQRWGHFKRRTRGHCKWRHSSGVRRRAA